MEAAFLLYTFFSAADYAGCALSHHGPQALGEQVRQAQMMKAEGQLTGRNPRFQ
jgi:hypothetical protein